MAQLSEEVRRAAGRVIEPHMNVTLEAMGMIRSVEVTGQGAATVGMLFPCIGCPAWDLLQNQVREAAARVPGVTSVRVRIAWGETWSKADVAPAVRERVSRFGYAI